MAVLDMLTFLTHEKTLEKTCHHLLQRHPAHPAEAIGEYGQQPGHCGQRCLLLGAQIASNQEMRSAKFRSLG